MSLTTNDKSKEEIEHKFKILDKINGSSRKGELKFSSDEISCDTAFKAMDYFAQHQALAFTKWVTGTINPIYVYNGNGAWEVIKPSRTQQPKEFISDEQLYQLFIQDTQSKQ